MITMAKMMKAALETVLDFFGPLLVAGCAILAIVHVASRVMGSGR